MTLSTVELLLLGMMLFSLKHWLCDFVLQTQYQVNNKGHYGHPAGILHALEHALLTQAVLIVTWTLGAPITISQVWQLSVLDMIIHYHVDWLKCRFSSGLTVKDNKFWLLFGLDQLAHSLTYVMILWIVFT